MVIFHSYVSHYQRVSLDAFENCISGTKPGIHRRGAVASSVPGPCGWWLFCDINECLGVAKRCHGGKIVPKSKDRKNTAWEQLRPSHCKICKKSKPKTVICLLPSDKRLHNGKSPSLSSVNQRTFNKGHGWATSRSVTIITKGYLLASASLAHYSRSCARIEATGTAGATWGKTCCQLLRFFLDIWYFVDEIRCDIYDLKWFEMVIKIPGRPHYQCLTHGSPD